jgi:hypothetical protein
MKTVAIKTKRGDTFFIDEEDLELISQYSWWSNKQKRINGLKRMPHVSLPRLIMKCPPGLVVDHIDRNPFNNCKSNLRICTSWENSQNRTIPRSNKSGYQNVHYYRFKYKGKYYPPTIRINFTIKGKSYAKTGFKSLEDAHIYCEKWRKDLLDKMKEHEKRG